MYHLNAGEFVVQTPDRAIDLHEFDVYPQFILSLHYRVAGVSASPVVVEILDAVTNTTIAALNFPATGAETNLVIRHMKVTIVTSSKRLQLKVKAPVDVAMDVNAVSFIPGDVYPEFLPEYLISDSELGGAIQNQDAKVVAFDTSYNPSATEALVDAAPYLLSGNIASYDPASKSFVFNLPGVYEILASVDGFNADPATTVTGGSTTLATTTRAQTTSGQTTAATTSGQTTAATTSGQTTAATTSGQTTAATTLTTTTLTTTTEHVTPPVFYPSTVTFTNPLDGTIVDNTQNLTISVHLVAPSATQNSVTISDGTNSAQATLISGTNVDGVWTLSNVSWFAGLTQAVTITATAHGSWQGSVAQPASASISVNITGPITLPPFYPATVTFTTPLNGSSTDGSIPLSASVHVVANSTGITSVTISDGTTSADATLASGSTQDGIWTLNSSNWFLGTGNKTLTATVNGTWAGTTAPPVSDSVNIYAYVNTTPPPTTTEAPILIPQILIQPQGGVIREGQPATLSVSATSDGRSPSTYQWVKGGLDIPGANGTTYSIGSVTYPTDETSYAVKVSNSAGTATSNTTNIVIERQYHLYTSVSGNGTVTPTPPGSMFWANDPRTVSYAASPGYSVIGYTIDGGSMNSGGSGGFTETGTRNSDMYVVVYFTQPASNVSIDSFNTDTNSIGAGQPVTLSWSTTNASSVSISGVGAVAASGSTIVYPSAATDYVLTAQGTGGPITRSVHVAVSAYPAGWHISSRSGSSSYTVNSTGGFAIYDGNGYPITDPSYSASPGPITSIDFSVSGGTLTYPGTIASGVNANWVSDWTAPNSGGPVYVDATVNVVGGLSYALPTYVVSVIALGNPIINYMEPDFVTMDNINIEVHYSISGAASARINGIDIPYPNGIGTQLFVMTWDHNTGQRTQGPTDVTLEAYGGPNYTGTMVSQTITI
jgi:hypothetical protein